MTIALERLKARRHRALMRAAAAAGDVAPELTGVADAL